MSDPYASYEIGLQRLLWRLGEQHPRYTEASAFEGQLRENIGLARSRGDNENLRADRNRILDQLIKLSLATVGVSFSQLCQTAEEPPRPGTPVRAPAARSPATVTQAGTRYDVFVSYGHADQGWVRDWLVPRLRQAGLQVCVDYDSFLPGEPVVRAIERAVQNSRTTLLVLSPSYLESELTAFETILAQTISPAAYNRQVVPVLYQPCDAQTIPLRIRALIWADLTKSEKRDAEMARLLDSIVPPSPSAAKKRRRIDAAAPSQANVGEHVDLLVQVRFPNSSLLGIKDWPTRHKPSSVEQASDGVSLTFPPDPTTGKPGPALLEIRVVAPDFSIEGQAQQKVEVPPDAYSQCISFLLTANRPGTCPINVQVYTPEQVYVGTIPLETTVGAVGEVPAAPISAVANLFLFILVGSVPVAPLSAETSEEAEARLSRWPPMPETQAEAKPREPASIQPASPLEPAPEQPPPQRRARAASKWTDWDKALLTLSMTALVSLLALLAFQKSIWPPPASIPTPTASPPTANWRLQVQAPREGTCALDSTATSYYEPQVQHYVGRDVLFVENGSAIYFELLNASDYPRSHWTLRADSDCRPGECGGFVGKQVQLSGQSLDIASGERAAYVTSLTATSLITFTISGEGFKTGCIFQTMPCPKITGKPGILEIKPTEALWVELTGEGFAPDATVSISQGAEKVGVSEWFGPDHVSTVFERSALSSFDLCLPVTITLQNPSLISDTAVVTAPLGPCKPQITDVYPKQGRACEQVPITITGRYFQEGCTVTLQTTRTTTTEPLGNPFSNTEHLVATWQLPRVAVTTTAWVEVTNPDHQSDVIAECFAIIPPQPPTPPHVVVEAVPETQISLRWEPSADGTITGFRVYRDGKPLVTVDSHTTRWSDKNAASGEKHCYSVSAYNDCGESAPSEAVCPTLPVRPPEVARVEGSQTDDFNLTWSWGRSLKATERFQPHLGRSEENMTPRQPITATTFTIGGALHNCEYWFCVCVIEVDSAGKFKRDVTDPSKACRFIWNGCELQGDVNKDGKVTSADLTAFEAARKACGTCNACASSIEIQRADVDGNCKLEDNDADIINANLGQDCSKCKD